MIIDGNKITAADGMTLTNGDTYGKVVYLGIYDSPENWSEIHDSDVPSGDAATDEDYTAALNDLGVNV